MGRLLGRIKRRADFLRLNATARKWVGRGFVLQACPHLDQSTKTRVGFTVSRKVGGAVARNRAKRRLRALADRVVTDMETPAADYVLIGRRETVTVPFSEMEQELRIALQELNKTTVKKDTPT